MPRSLAAAALALLVLTAGCTALDTDSAAVTVENEKDVEYTLTASMVEEPVGAGNVTFRATNDSGVRKTVGLRTLDTEGPHYDVTLAEEWNATERRVTVPPNGTTTATFEVWDSGDPVVYLIAGPDGRLVRPEFAECERDSLEHTFVLTDRVENGFEMRCA